MPEFNLKTEISLGNVLALLSSVASIFYFIISLESVNKTQAVEIDHVKQEISEVSNRQTLNSTKMYDLLRSMDEKLNQLIGKVNATK
jgi:hypothetical protein